MGFKYVPFEELFDIPLRNGLSKPKKVRGKGYPMVNMGEIFAYNRIYDIPMDLVPMSDREKEVAYLNKNDLLFARQSLTLEGAGKCSVYLGTSGETTYESHLIRVRLNKEVCNPLYYYYFFQSPLGKQTIENIVEQVAAAGIRGSDLKRIKVPLLDLNQQNKIVNTLNLIDEKIEINLKMISNLEKLAQTIFKSWFVDFEYPNENGEPYNSSGGEMVESELGVMPQSWHLGTLNDLGKIVGGGTPSKKVASYYTDNGYSWITPKDLSNDRSVFIYKGAIDITEEALKKSSAKLYPEKTVLFSSRAPIGYVAIAGQKVATNQGFKSIIPNENIPSEYIYSLLIHLTPVIEANAGGSTFKEISGAGMKGIKTVIPSEHVLANYKLIAEPLFNKIKEVEKENRSLISLRDTLLPKLLSGEIELPNESEVTEDVPVS